MAFTIPDKGEGDSNTQSIWFQEEIDVVIAGLTGVDCVLSGLGVTGGSDMTPAVAKGSVLTNGVLKAVAAADVTITTADATHPRIDLIVVNSSGALAVRAGTPAASPKPPARTANDVVIAQVYVPANDTTIGAGAIIDKRVFRQQGPIVIHKVTTNVNNAANVTTAVELVNISIPDGLLLSGRQLRLKAGGIYQTNAAVTLTVNASYGGTAVFTDSTGSTGTGTNPGAWDIEILITAQADAVQVITGRVGIQRVANKTNAAVGIGEIDITAHQITPIAHTTTLNSNNANRALILTMNMNANAANRSFAQYSATVELL